MILGVFLALGARQGGGKRQRPLFFSARMGDSRPLGTPEACAPELLWFVAQSRPPLNSMFAPCCVCRLCFWAWIEGWFVFSWALRPGCCQGMAAAQVFGSYSYFPFFVLAQFPGNKQRPIGEISAGGGQVGGEADLMDYLLAFFVSLRMWWKLGFVG